MSCDTYNRAFCAAVCAPGTPAAQILGGGDHKRAAAALEELQSLARTRAERAAAGEDRLADLQARAADARAREQAVAALLRMRDIMAGVAGWRLPVHGEQQAGAPVPLPRDRAALHGFAALEETLAALETSQPLPLLAQQVRFASLPRGGSTGVEAVRARIARAARLLDLANGAEARDADRKLIEEIARAVRDMPGGKLEHLRWTLARHDGDPGADAALLGSACQAAGAPRCEQCGRWVSPTETSHACPPPATARPASQALPPDRAFTLYAAGMPATPAMLWRDQAIAEAGDMLGQGGRVEVFPSDLVGLTFHANVAPGRRALVQRLIRNIRPCPGGYEANAQIGGRMRTVRQLGPDLPWDLVEHPEREPLTADRMRGWRMSADAIARFMARYSHGADLATLFRDEPADADHGDDLLQIAARLDPDLALGWTNQAIAPSVGRLDKLVPLLPITDKTIVKAEERVRGLVRRAQTTKRYAGDEPLARAVLAAIHGALYVDAGDAARHAADALVRGAGATPAGAAYALRRHAAETLLGITLFDQPLHL